MTLMSLMTKPDICHTVEKNLSRGEYSPQKIEPKTVPVEKMANIRYELISFVNPPLQSFPHDQLQG